jgi:hypothetical protein
MAHHAPESVAASNLEHPLRRPGFQRRVGHGSTVDLHEQQRLQRLPVELAQVERKRIWERRIFEVSVAIALVKGL